MKEKNKLKGICINFCSRQLSKDVSARTLLSNLSVHLKAQIDAGRVSLFPVYQSILSQIAGLELKVAEGARVRSRVRWAEEGETSSSYFLRLEKKRGAENWISSMSNPDGSFATGISEICESWVDFYDSLFTSSIIDDNVQSSLLDNLTQSLSDESSRLCDGPITIQEAT